MLCSIIRVPRLLNVSKDDSIDAIPIAFVNTFFGTGGLPVLNLANVSLILELVILHHLEPFFVI